MTLTAPSCALDADDEDTLARHRLMQLQSNLSLPYELDFYQECAQWQGARSVLDLGTGNGHYLLGLAREFPAKRYHGVDSCAEHVAFAEAARDRQPLLSGQIEFSLCDVLDVEGCFDFAIARHLVEHLPFGPRLATGGGGNAAATLDAVLERAARVIRPGGTLLVVESYDRERWFWPRVPNVEAFLESHRHRRCGDRYRRDGGFVVSRLAIDAGFEVAKRIIQIVPSTGVAGREQFVDSFGCLLEVIRLDGGLTAACTDMRRELARWAETPEAYAQIGVSMTCYRRMER